MPGPSAEAAPAATASAVGYHHEVTHRYEAHQVIGRVTIACRVRALSPATLRMHLA